MIVVAIEGFDGAGKTTLLGNLVDDLTRRGFRCASVGRGRADATAHVASMTATIKESDGGLETLPPLSDMYLRLARLHARIAIVEALDCDVVFLDRFLLYDLSRVPEQLADAHAALFEQVAATLHVDLTVHLTGSFEVMWARVSKRPASDLSPKEALGREHNHEGYRGFEHLMRRQRLYPSVKVVDCSRDADDVTGTVAASLQRLLSHGIAPLDHGLRGAGTTIRAADSPARP